MATLRGMSALPHDFWAGFALDPRHPAHAGLRAADEDREHVHRLLSEAYARGQLSPEEHDERVDFVAGARTLGELPPVVDDLVGARAQAERGEPVLEGDDLIVRRGDLGVPTVA